MAADEFHVGDIGNVLTVIVADGGTAVNISTATTKTIRITKPDGTVMEKSASFTVAGADGSMYWKTVSGDFSLAGAYRIQGFVAFANASPAEQYSTEKATFQVFSNLT